MQRLRRREVGRSGKGARRIMGFSATGISPVRRGSTKIDLSFDWPVPRTERHRQNLMRADLGKHVTGRHERAHDHGQQRQCRQRLAEA